MYRACTERSRSVFKKITIKTYNLRSKSETPLPIFKNYVSMCLVFLKKITIKTYNLRSKSETSLPIL